MISRLSLVNTLGIQSTNPYIRWFFCILFWICLLQLAVWWSDEKPPFEVDSYQVMPVKRGETAFVSIRVRRDLDRRCYANFTRYLFDSKGYRHTYGSEETMTPSGIRKMDKLSPNEIRLALPIPEHLSPGKARYVTDLTYRCNPLHLLKPIQVQMEVDIEILS